MGKRLILILALVFVAAFTVAAYAEVQNVKVSGDLTAYGIARNLTLKDTKAAGNSWDKDLASIARLRVDADLTDNVIATVRLLNERYWGTESDDHTNPGDGENSNVDIDLAYATMKEFLYSPMTLTIGRQELHFGNEMIIGDPDTNNAVDPASPFYGATTLHRDADLSARKAFDAIRLTLNYDPLVIDGVFAKVKEQETNLQNDTTLCGVNANYAINKDTTVEAYFFSKDIGQKTTEITSIYNKNKYDRVHVLGARLATQLIDKLTYQLEAAYQLGKKYNGATLSNPDRRGYAIETALSYNMANVKYTPLVSVVYALLSGEKGNSDKQSRAWDPMYENQTFGSIANALFNQSNAHIAGLTGAIKPVEDVTLKGEYYAFWWDKKYGENQVIPTVRNPSATLVMRHNKFAGQEVDVTATYDYTEDVQFSLLGGVFIPGNSFNQNNDNPASELIGSMKVTF